MNNYDAAKRIIKITEDLSNLPVRVVWDDELQVGAIVHLSEIELSQQIRISVKPGRKDTAYLVALQCAMAKNFIQSKSADHKHLVSASESINKAIAEFIQLGYPENVAQQIANQTIPSLGQQLRGMPPQLVLSSWIYREFPELRESQLIHHIEEVNVSYASLDIDPQQYPSWILKNHQAMNGAFALASEYLFDRSDLFLPFKKSGLETICTNLLKPIISNQEKNNDVILVSEWIEILDLGSEFCWSSYE